ncbi:unnamed protein product [Rotaria socialis]|uniref:Uncharacterized protein n=1 Tax=Rotaria socialis TaxID=392032 RepID=A0A819WF29_9BILA|nr:unnamed protein product [Rotaria socialis]
MASANRCSVCKTRAGTCFCPGCKAYFCDDDFQNHRASLFDELNVLTSDRNDLHAQINEVSSNMQTDKQLAKVDEWQRTTIEKVKQAAESARQQIMKIKNSKHEEIAKSFLALSQELDELRETKGIVEQDIVRLNQAARKLSEDLKKCAQSSEIELNVKQSDEIDWNRMIYVEKNSAFADNQSQMNGEHFSCICDENGHLNNLNKQRLSGCTSPTKLSCDGHTFPCLRLNSDCANELLFGNRNMLLAILEVRFSCDLGPSNGACRLTFEVK